MKKLNRNHLSFYEFLGLGKRDKTAPRGYSTHGFRYHDGADKNPLYAQKVKGNVWVIHIYPDYQLLGAIRPFAKIGSDFASIVKPYYSTNMIKRDLLQPLRGIFNILKGIGSIMGGMVLLALWIVALPFLAIGACIPFISIFATPAIVRGIYPVSWIIEGVANITRGTVQLFTSPLNIIKMPVRGIITWLFPEKNAEERSDIKRFAAQAYLKLEAINDYAPKQSNDIHKEEASGDRKHRTAEKNRRNSNQSLSTNNKAIKKNQCCFQERREFASLLFEIQHQYNKSIHNGWKTDLNQSDATCSSLSIFVQAANESTHNEVPQTIEEKDIQSARIYLEKFPLPLQKK